MTYDKDGNIVRLEIGMAEIIVITKTGKTKCIKEIKASALDIYNSGNVPALVNKGRTLKIDGSMSLGSQSDLGIWKDEIHITLDTTGITNPNPRVEITPITTNICE